MSTNETPTCNVVDSNAGPKYYVNAKILGEPVRMLLDTGSQVSIVTESQCSPEVLAKLAPSPVSVTAYNGSAIDIKGVFKTDIIIDDITIRETPIYVTGNNFKPILGTPALSGIVLDFTDCKIRSEGRCCSIHLSSDSLDTQNFNLKALSRRRQREIYQVYTTVNTTIPVGSEAVLPVRIKNDFDSYGVFTTEPASCSIKGCVIAKSLSFFSKSSKQTAVRICNVSSKPVSINARSAVVKVAAVESILEPTPAKIATLKKEIKIGKSIGAYEKEIIDLIEEYSDVFAGDNEPLGKTDAVEFHVDTGSHPPVAQQKYKTPYFLRTELKRIIDKNLQNGLMEECSSPWAAPTLLVKKANGTWRLVVDYRKLNQVTTADCYPLPEINECVNELAESKIFSTTDLFSGFHQIPTTEEAKQKLAVITDFGQFTWRRMPMGAKNCPSVFQRMMDKCFRTMPLSVLVIYLDDIVIHSKTIQDHVIQLKNMFEILRKNNLQIRADKTVLAVKEINFCGYKIRNGTKFPNSEKVQAVKNLRCPASKKEAQMVFGLLNYHRAFIPCFAKKAAPITKTYNAKGAFLWSKEADQALSLLKSEICNAALHLKIPPLKTAKFVLETDACDSGFAGTLFLCNNEKPHDKHNASCLRPVEYMSAQFTPAQTRYYIQEKELFAGKEAMKKWSHFLLGRPFDWHIDNACLKWAHRIRSSKLKISQWLAEIAEFDARTILKPTAAMKVTDCLSRQFTEVNLIRVSRADVKTLQENDAIVGRVRNFTSNERWPNDCNGALNFYKKLRDKLLFGPAGELMLQDETTLKLVVPEVIKNDILKNYHDRIGHPGIDKTLTEISSRYVWPEMQTDVRAFISSCHVCQISKPNLKPKQPPLGQSETAAFPHELLAFDLIGPLPVTDRDYRYVLVGTDLFTKKIYTAPLTSKHADTISMEIERILCANPVLPKSILTDHGREFFGVTTLCESFGIQHNKSPPYHPQTNGAVERMNQTLKQRLFELDNNANWDERLNQITHSINCSKNVVTGYSPFELETGVKGQNLFDPIEMQRQHAMDPETLRRIALQRIEIEKANRIEKHDKPNFEPFTVDQLVLAKNHREKMPRFLGPFIITKVRADGLSYEIKELDSQATQIRSVGDLKPYTLRQQTVEPGEHVFPTQDHQPESSVDFFDDDDFSINFFPPAETVHVPEQSASLPYTDSTMSHSPSHTSSHTDIVEGVNVEDTMATVDLPDGLESETNEAAEDLVGINITHDAASPSHRTVTDDIDTDNDCSSRNVTLTQSCRTYSQDSLANSQTNSLVNSTHDCWIEDDAQISQQSEYDRQQADANLQEIKGFLDELSETSSISNDERDSSTSRQQEDTTIDEDADGDDVTTSAETDYETAGEDSPDKAAQPRYGLRNRDSLRRPNRLIENDSDTEELEADGSSGPRRKSNASLISVVEIDQAPEDRDDTSCSNAGDNLEADRGDATVSSNRWSGISITLEDMNKNQLKEIAKKNGLQISSRKPELRKTIDKFFAEKLPHWRRNSLHQLVFKRRLELEKPTPITALSKKELQEVALYFGKDHICDKTGFILKVDWRNALNLHLKTLFSDAQCDKNNLIILTPAMFGQEP